MIPGKGLAWVVNDGESSPLAYDLDLLSDLARQADFCDSWPPLIDIAILPVFMCCCAIGVQKRHCRDVSIH